MKAKILIVVVLVAGLAAVIWWKPWIPKQKLPNILLITLDTTRLDHLSCYGYHLETTPNLDLLAKEGQVFENALAVSSWTLPTHASLFTGLYPSTHGAHYSSSGKQTFSSALDMGREEFYESFRVNGLPEEAVTLAEVLKKAGYRTGGVGAGPWMKPLFGVAQGFDYYSCNVDATWGKKADEISATGNFFIRKNKDAPFFLFLNYFDPHAPYWAPKEYESKFYDMSDRIESAEIIKYDAEIAFMDFEIGRVFQQLKDLGLYDDTWIIVMGDHGELLGEHMLKGHGYTLYQETIRSPLIIKWPAGWSDPPSTEQQCQQVDIMPTIIQRLGIDSGVRFEGQPLGEVNHPLVCELYRNQAFVDSEGPRFDRDLIAVYADSYKLILSTKENDQDAGLFDLEKDPGEETDLADKKPQISNNLRGALKQWRKMLLDPLIPKEIKSIDDDTKEQLEALGYGK